MARTGSSERLPIAIIGSGAAGLSAAWLLAQRHDVTLLEKDDRPGGHAHTAILQGTGFSADGSSAKATMVDTGFIVYNEPCYPNLTRWFDQLGVQTEASDMSFAVSRDNGCFEYAGGPPLGLLAQPSLLLRARYWRMLRDLLRFYREAPRRIPADSELTLGEFLKSEDYSDAFLQDHLLPFGAAIWSTSRNRMLDYPAAAFIRFCDNHGLLRITKRPRWRTVTCGSQSYVNTVSDAIGRKRIRTDFSVSRVERLPDRVLIHDESGEVVEADQVVIATHADQALSLLQAPTGLERELLSVFRYESNRAVLHTDTRFLPRRRRAWCSWNYVEQAGVDPDSVSVSYWMNRLQNIVADREYIVTLNPGTPPAPESILRSTVYEHPVFNAATYRAQQALWSLQGQQRSWYCGSYFGAGFHEDAVQAGFAVAEQLGGHARPWSLANPSSRIVAAVSAAQPHSSRAAA